MNDVIWYFDNHTHVLDTYNILCNFLANELKKIEPESIMTDFEMAFRKSYTKSFPNTKQRRCRCYFHHQHRCYLEKKIQTIPVMEQRKYLFFFKN